MGLVALLDTLRARFAARGLTGIEIVEGREALNEQGNYGAGQTNRIAFYEPEEPGDVAPPFRIGDDDEHRRRLLLVTAPLAVAFAGYDADRPSRYLAHRDRCLELWELTAQELQLELAGVHRWGGWKWNTTRKHGAFGAELIASLSIDLEFRDVDADASPARPRPGAPKPVAEAP